MAIDGTDDLAAALPGYEIGGELGRGAFGVVLVARHRQLGRQVAIKQLPRSFSEYPEVRRRFSAEAKILASLDHPHIVPIFDYVEHGGLCLLVMEMLPGGTVREWVSSGMSSQAACAVALATCSALDYAHQRGVLHRDVKPDNLLFTSAGLLKVTDFGIAKVVGDIAVTQVGETPGTPLYMAPEQCLGQALSPATDVYSTGLMLYELLAGAHPFAGADIVSTMYRQVHEEAPPLRSTGQAVPGAISTVVMRSMAKDPAARYSSARTFGGALADAAAAAWGSSWPAGDALRIMSLGPIEATTGRVLITGPPGSANVTRITPGTADTPTVVASPLQPTVFRSGAGAPRPPAPGATETFRYPQPPAPPGEPPPPRPTPGSPPAAARGKAPWVALAAVLVALAVVGGLLIANRDSGRPATSPPTPAATRTTTQPAQVAAAFSRLIQQSGAARSQLVTTVASIENCSSDPAAATAALAAAVTTRQQIVSQVQALAVDALPNGTAMGLAFTNALNDSIDADRHFQSWLSAITAGGGCQGQAPHDANWQAAQASSSAATGAKQTFAALWNPVAATYSLPKVSSATI